ncbi:MAG: hypothetical protein AAF597_01345 [Bacteroidota bacterium]
MQSTKPTRSDKLTWAAAFPGSGLTAKDYASQAGCSVAKLYYWRAQLRSDDEPVSFTTITVTEETTAGELHLRLPGGVEVYGGPVELAAFVRQLRDYA